MGQIYVEVDASVANGGIMTLQASGDGGGEAGSYWINWDPNNGFVGTGWKSAWESPHVPLKENWIANPAEGYDTTYDEFVRYVITSGTQDLSTWLGNSWTNDMKIAFMQDVTGVVSCLSPTM